MKPILITGAALAMSAVILVQHNRAGQLQAQNDTLQSRIQQAESTTAAPTDPTRPSPAAPANDPRETELLRLRGEVARLRSDAAKLSAAEAELARLRLVFQEQQAHAQKQDEINADTKSPYNVQRKSTTEAFKYIGLQLRILIKSQKGADAFQADGTLKPDLIARNRPDFDLSTVEVLVNDPGQIEELINKNPDTIITRTRDPIPTPDGRFLRIYGLSDGSVEQRTTESPDLAYASNGQIERIKPRAQ